MANKLKKMELSSVDLCRHGANPESYIKLFKSAISEMKGGENKDMSKQSNFFEKVGRLVFKMANDEQQENDMEPIAKSACYDEIGAMAAAIQKSLVSIVEDETLTAIEKNDMIVNSLHEFNEEVANNAEMWAVAVEKADSGGEYPDDPEDEIPPEDEEPEDGDSNGGGGKQKFKPKNKKITKGEFDLATINIEKMSADDRATLEALEKKYSGSEAEVTQPAAVEPDPDVKKAMDEVAELRKSLEIKDLEIIAKKYEPIGKKADELAPKLYELKKAGEGLYADYISALDEQLTLTNNSGVFKEYGSSKGASGGDLQAIVTDIMKSAPDLTREQAVIRAFETNPNLDPYTGRLK